MKTMLINMVLTSHLIVGLLYITSPSFAQATTVIPPNETHVSKDGVVTVGDYLPMPDKPAEDTTFKLLSVNTNENQTTAWPELVSVTVNTIVITVTVCTIITITICLIVLGVIIYVVVKMLRCLDRLLNPTNNNGATSELNMTLSSLTKSTTAEIGNPLKVWDLSSVTPLESSVNLHDWYPCLTVSNKLWQMENTDCYLRSEIYKGGIQLTSILKRIYITLATNSGTVTASNEPTTLTFPNLACGTMVGTNQTEFFRGTGSNHINIH